MVRNIVRWFIFQYAVLTGHDEYAAEAGTWKFRLLNWVYEGDAEPEFDVQWPEE